MTRSACVLAIQLSLVAASACAADTIYYFVDEHGVAHLTNVPSDPRYQAVAETPKNPIAAAAESEQTPQPTNAAVDVDDDEDSLPLPALPPFAADDR